MDGTQTDPEAEVRKRDATLAGSDRLALSPAADASRRDKAVASEV